MVLVRYVGVVGYTDVVGLPGLVGRPGLAGYLGPVGHVSCVGCAGSVGFLCIIRYLGLTGCRRIGLLRPLLGRFTELCVQVVGDAVEAVFEPLGGVAFEHRAGLVEEFEACPGRCGTGGRPLFGGRGGSVAYRCGVRPGGPGERKVVAVGHAGAGALLDDTDACLVERTVGVARRRFDRGTQSPPGLGVPHQPAPCLAQQLPAALLRGGDGLFGLAVAVGTGVVGEYLDHDRGGAEHQGEQDDGALVRCQVHMLAHRVGRAHTGPDADHRENGEGEEHRSGRIRPGQFTGLPPLRARALGPDRLAQGGDRTTVGPLQCAGGPGTPPEDGLGQQTARGQQADGDPEPGQVRQVVGDCLLLPQSEEPLHQCADEHSVEGHADQGGPQQTPPEHRRTAQALRPVVGMAGAQLPDALLGPPGRPGDGEPLGRFDGGLCLLEGAGDRGCRAAEPWLRRGQHGVGVGEGTHEGGLFAVVGLVRRP